MDEDERPERRNYRRLYVRIWNTPQFMGLPDHLKVLTLYALSGPQTNRVGIYVFSCGQAAEHLRADGVAIKTRLRIICNTFRWEVDYATNVIWIPSWWDYNPVDNLKTFTGYLTDLNDLPRTVLGMKFCQHTAFLPHSLHATLRTWGGRLSYRTLGSESKSRSSSPCDPSAGSPSTETETETETGTKSVSGEASSPPPATRPPPGQSTARTQPASQGPFEARRAAKASTGPRQTNASVPAASPNLAPADAARVGATFLEFPVVGSTEKTWALTEAQLATWTELFPHHDLRSHARAALAWVLAHTERQKTAGGMPRFLVGWFTRAVNRGDGARAPTSGPVGVSDKTRESLAARERNIARLRQGAG